MSGYAKPILAVQGRLDPDVTLLDKPFTERELLDKVSTVLSATSNTVEALALADHEHAGARHASSHLPTDLADNPPRSP